MYQQSFGAWFCLFYEENFRLKRRFGL